MGAPWELLSIIASDMYGTADPLSVFIQENEKEIVSHITAILIQFILSLTFLF